MEVGYKKQQSCHVANCNKFTHFETKIIIGLGLGIHVWEYHTKKSEALFK